MTPVLVCSVMAKPESKNCRSSHDRPHVPVRGDVQNANRHRNERVRLHILLHMGLLHPAVLHASFPEVADVGRVVESIESTEPDRFRGGANAPIFSATTRC